MFSYLWLFFLGQAQNILNDTRIKCKEQLFHDTLSNAKTLKSFDKNILLNTEQIKLRQG